MITQKKAKAYSSDIHYCASDIDTEMGLIRLWSDGKGICMVQLPGMGSPVLYEIVQGDDISRCAATQLKEWIENKRTVFDLPLSIHVTIFAQKVYEALQKVPIGSTVSYGHLGTMLGMPLGARAVAGALKRNPVPILIPCHRVVGSDGNTVGYMGIRKNPVQDWLLKIESSYFGGKK